MLVRNIPVDPHESICELVEHFFKVNHPDHYLTFQVKSFSEFSDNVHLLVDVLDLSLTQAVHDATKLSELVQTRKQMQNLLDYNINKHMRTLSKRPVIKVKVKSHLQKASSDVSLQDSFLLVCKSDGVSWLLR